MSQAGGRRAYSRHAGSYSRSSSHSAHAHTSGKSRSRYATGSSARRQAPSRHQAPARHVRSQQPQQPARSLNGSAGAPPQNPRGPQRKKKPVGRTILGIIIAIIAVVAIISIASSAKQCSSLFGDIEENTYDWSRLVTDGDIKSYTSPSGLKAKLGVDVSSHNGGSIDWNQLAQSGVEFAYVRCGYRGYTEGFIQTDEQADRNITAAKAAGIDPAVYIFSQAISVEEAREEADFACDAMERHGLDKSYPVAFDMEENNVSDERIDGLSAEELTEIALAFCDRVRERGYTPIVYGNDKWLNGYFDLSKLAGKELIWLAEYSDKPSVEYAFKMWQYTSTADLPGSGGNLDMDLLFPDS